MDNFKYVRTGEEIPANIPAGSVLDIQTTRTTAYTHGFHKYPGKFIPQIPRWAIMKFLGENAGKNVLDPFCGSGTTLVESLLTGNAATGVDVDPLSVMITQVKTRPVNVKMLNDTAEWLVGKIRAKKGRPFRPECPTLEHWFTPEAISNLGIIRAAINDLPREFGKSQSSRHIARMWLVCFSSILRRASNADNESQKTFVSHTNPKTPEDPMILFERRAALFVGEITKFTRKVGGNSAGRVFMGNGDFPPRAKTVQADLVVTSPPYIKAIDYIYNQMVELFWIGDLFNLQTQTLQNERKALYIGNKQVPMSLYRAYSPESESTGFPALDRVLRRIYRNDPKNGKHHAFITREYFLSMSRHIRQMAGILRPNTPYVMVIGNCQVSGVNVDVKRIISDIALKEGFSITNWWGYKIKNRYMRFDRAGRGGIIKHDWVLEMSLNK